MSPEEPGPRSGGSFPPRGEAWTFTPGQREQRGFVARPHGRCDPPRRPRRGVSWMDLSGTRGRPNGSGGPEIK